MKTSETCGIVADFKNIWQDDDFTTCFRHEILGTLVPFIVVSICTVYAVVRHLRWRSKHVSSRYDSGNGYLPVHTEEDEAMEVNQFMLRPNRYSAGQRIRIWCCVLSTLGAFGLSIYDLVNAVTEDTHVVESLISLVGWTLTLITVMSILLIPKSLFNVTTFRRAFFHHAKHISRFLYQFVALECLLALLDIRTSIISRPSRDSQILTAEMVTRMVYFVLATIILVVLPSYISYFKPPRIRIRNPQTNRYPTLERTATLWEKMTFSWFNEIIDIGDRKCLDDSDLWELWNEDTAESVNMVWENISTDRPNRKLLQRLFLLVRPQLLTQQGYALVSSLLAFTNPYFLHLILSYVQHPVASPYRAFSYALGLFVCNGIRILCDGQTYFNGRRIGMRVRAVIIGMIYKKSLKRVSKTGSSGDGGLAGDVTNTKGTEVNGSETKSEQQSSNSSSSKASASTGEIVNLMAVDTQKILEVACYLHYIWCTPLQVVICIALLIQVMGWPALIGLVWMVIMIPIGGLLGRGTQRAQKAFMKAIDGRMRAVSEMLQAMKIIKLLAWEPHFSKYLNRLRSHEISTLKRYIGIAYLSKVAWASTPIFVSLLSFFAFSKFTDRVLDASTAFTALALFNTLRHPLQGFPDIIVRTLEALVSIRRVEKFMDEEDLEDAVTRFRKASHRKRKLTGEPGDVVQVKGTFVYFSASPEQNERKKDIVLVNLEDAHDQKIGDAVVQNSIVKSSKSNELRNLPEEIEPDATSIRFALGPVDVQFPVGKLSLIVGATGAGKTTLLLAMLGEMRKLHDRSGPFPSKTHNRSMTRPIQPVDIHALGVAYVSQTAWLMNCTIRDNVLFGEPYDEALYQRVLDVCALKKDLELMDAGDMTEIGEKGVNLSGGQKQRISLARAAYSSADVVILDDVFSAVDAPTGRHLYEECVLKFLLELRRRTIILVTHAVAMTLPRADFVVVLAEGKVVEIGSPGKLSRSRSLQDMIDAEKRLQQRQIEERQDRSRKQSTVQHEEKQMSSPIKLHVEGLNMHNIRETEQGSQQQSPMAGRLTAEEARARGSVSLHVYKQYINAVGGTGFILLLLIAFILTQSLTVGQDYWVKVWSNAYKIPSTTSVQQASQAIQGPPLYLDLTHSSSESDSLLNNTIYAQNKEHENLVFWSSYPYGATMTFGITPFHGSGPLVVEARPQLRTTGISASANERSDLVQHPDTQFYALVYMIIGLAAVASLLGRLCIQAYGSLRASHVLHTALVERLLGAPLKFFDSTPVGRIMNRLGKDIQSVDQDIAVFCADTVGNFIALVSILIVVTVSTPMVLIGVLPVAIMACSVARRYLRSSREIKRLDSVTRSPIYSQFSETLDGVVTIRAFQAQERFIQANYRHIDNNHRAFFYLWVSNRWLAIRVDFIGATVAFLSASAILLSVFFRLKMDAGLAGLSLSYALIFTDALLWLVRMHALVEMSMNAVERVEEYLQVEQEAPPIISSARPPMNWPMRGTIDISNLVLSYSPDAPPVLRNINFTIEGGEHVALVGRTGAGKSSLTLALFRIVEVEGGSIMIDNVDISTLGLQDLRSRLTIIPQDSFLFAGTVRSNLDIFHEHDDDEILGILREVGLDSVTLDQEVHDHGANFSHGTRQVLCLVRALLRRSRILILDEPTSSVDHETDALIQKAIRESCSNTTVLCIAHRLSTVVDYDRVVVLDRGRVVEMGTPLELMQVENGYFWKMCKDSGDFDKLYQVAEHADSMKRSSDADVAKLIH